jgi:dUTP pyrophosphatase
MKIIKIMYHDPELEKIKRITQGDRIDLRAAEDVEMKAGEFKLISLGVSMQLPEGYEAILSPRSSTFKNYGILMANSFGCIDNSFCGSDDVWKFAAYATRDTVIHKNDRIAQFRIQPIQPEIFFKTVDNLDENAARGGFGSTGVK